MNFTPNLLCWVHQRKPDNVSNMCMNTRPCLSTGRVENNTLFTVFSIRQCLHNVDRFLHRVSKTCQLIFCSESVKYKSISIKKLVGMSWKKQLTKRCKNGQFHLKYVLALPWEIWDDRLTCQRSTYMYILMNYWIVQTRLAVIVFKIVKRVVKYIIFTLNAWNVRLQRVLRSQISTNWDYASETSEQSESRCLLNMRLATWRQRLSSYVRAGGRYFEHMMYRRCDLLHFWWFLRQ